MHPFHTCSSVSMCLSFIFLALILLSPSASSATDDLSKNIIEALQKVIFFMESEYKNINLDGAFGFRILQVQMEDIVKKWGPVLGCRPQHLLIECLLKQLKLLLEKTESALRRNDPQYYQEFEPILRSNFWILPHMWNQTDPTLVYHVLKDQECFHEETSDKCIGLLLGTWRNGGVPCMVTDTCKNIMTQPGCPDYSLSHQLLYIRIWKLKGCHHILEDGWSEAAASLAAQDFESVFCSNMMQGNLKIEVNGFPPHLRDLFMENILLCGLAGFSDFYKSHWLKLILSWQDPDTGCFRMPETTKSVNGKNPFEDLTQMLRRVKRRDKKLKDGCSSHTTAMAVGTLGGFLHYYQTSQWKRDRHRRFQ
ncbi:UPF0764 protein C16orf89 homolog [Protopterus annectens]|uniref:UPF0764 protein C16orf89 homolog n=1 Tax=Protopterus annectens TaxID=7888 RepID=UPI001CFBE81A|nr:UPF0764 protein C16orf89 homolog [Protopterus annectens]